MTQVTTKYFDSEKLLNLLDILPERLKEEGLNSKYVDQLRVLLALIQSHQDAISAHNIQFSDRRYPLPVLESQNRLIGTLV